MPCSFIGVFIALQFHRVFVALQFHRGVLPYSFTGVFCLTVSQGCFALQFHRGVYCPAVL